MGVVDAANRPGALVLFGSGETAAVGRQACAWLRSTGRVASRVAILETPAGFEPNADAVARRWADFLQRQPEMKVAKFVQLPLRRRDRPFGPDDAESAGPLLGADLIGLGAGSPTYAVRQLHDSRAWLYTRSAHLLGASLFLASAGAIAAGTYALPVYEIYKVGEDLHWKRGLRLFELYGLDLVVITHWDNTDGGAELDTSRCYMGAARFAELLTLIPDDVTVVGITEHTALGIDPAAATAQVLGRGSVTLLRRGEETRFEPGASFGVDAFGSFILPDIEAAVPFELAEAIHEARRGREPPQPPDLAALVGSREEARAARDWATADRVREKIEESGWRIDDTPAGPRLGPRKRG